MSAHRVTHTETAVGDYVLHEQVIEPMPARAKQAPVAAAATGGPDQPISVNDFISYLPAHAYLFIPTGALWPASSVNVRVGKIPTPSGKPVLATEWLDMHRAAEQMTWAPGQPLEIHDRLVADGGWIDRQGCRCVNLYRPPVLRTRPGDVDIYLDHVRSVFPDDAEHILRWGAHRVQRPHEKVNHALLLGGDQGIGKDTILEPWKHAVGPWNFTDITPKVMDSQFNGFSKSVILRISEARDLGEVDRFTFYEHLKTYTAAPPDVLSVNEKHVRPYPVMNVVGVVITTNHLTDGLHLPADDRRHYVAWSPLDAGHFDAAYFNRLYEWFEHGGFERVAHYLATLDLKDFNPKAPPPKTAAFWEIVNASRTPEDAETADALDLLGWPPAVTIAQIVAAAERAHNYEFALLLKDRKYARKVPFRLEACGYTAVRNKDADDGLWKLLSKRQVIYASNKLNEHDRLAAAERLRLGR